MKFVGLIVLESQVIPSLNFQFNLFHFNSTIFHLHKYPSPPRVSISIPFNHVFVWFTYLFNILCFGGGNILWLIIFFLTEFSVMEINLFGCFELKQGLFCFFGTSLVVYLNVNYICKLIMFNYFFFSFLGNLSLQIWGNVMSFGMYWKNW